MISFEKRRTKNGMDLQKLGVRTPTKKRKEQREVGTKLIVRREV